MAHPFSGSISLNEVRYNDQAYIGIEKLDAQRRSTGIDPASVDMANSLAVYAFGAGSEFGRKNFPILAITQGTGKKRAVKNYDGLVLNKIFGKPKTTSVIGKEINYGITQIGLNNAPFYMIFKDKHFQKNQIISTNGIMGNVQIQLSDDGERISEKAFKFKARVFGKKTDYIDVKYLKAGVVWAQGVIKVSLEHSRGTQSRSYNGYSVSNRLSTLRQSINVAGNASKAQLFCKIQADGQTFQFLYDWEKYLTERTFNAAREYDLLTSKDNSDEFGYVGNVDADSNKTVYSGNGLLRQIPTVNQLSYTYMTTNKLQQFITDSLSIAGNLDQDLSGNMVVDIHAGIGLLQDIDKAMKDSLSTFTKLPDSNYIVKEGANGGLRMGGYFTEYQHISGVIYRFTHHLFFDTSSLALSAPKHPISNLPITSHEGIIMNFSKVSIGDSKTANNIEFQYEDGREYYEGTVRGMAAIEGKQGGEMATDIDASAMHMMATQGVHCHNPLSLGYIKCKLS